MEMKYIIGLILGAIGGGLVGANSKNRWPLLGLALAQIGVILL
jgi:hypothetical protein